MPALLEYGDARIPSHFEAIRQYSPYQAVRDGVDYPAVMLTTGDLDTRVSPLQARRMTARLQAASSSESPSTTPWRSMIVTRVSIAAPRRSARGSSCSRVHGVWLLARSSLAARA